MNLRSVIVIIKSPFTISRHLLCQELINTVRDGQTLCVSRSILRNQVNRRKATRFYDPGTNWSPSIPSGVGTTSYHLTIASAANGHSQRSVYSDTRPKMLKGLDTIGNYSKLLLA